MDCHVDGKPFSFLILCDPEKVLLLLLLMKNNGKQKQQQATNSIKKQTSINYGKNEG